MEKIPLKEITKKSSFTGVVRTLFIAVTQTQLDDWENGALIQDAMPHLTTDEREFLMTGTTPDEWDAVFKEE
ncbi:hypothetical protein N9933_03605 [bacterium]|nr:hypothetical protein [bacterium]